jgi:hypothetical protein
MKTKNEIEKALSVERSIPSGILRRKLTLRAFSISIEREA